MAKLFLFALSREIFIPLLISGRSLVQSSVLSLPPNPFNHPRTLLALVRPTLLSSHSLHPAHLTAPPLTYWRPLYIFLGRSDVAMDTHSLPSTFYYDFSYMDSHPLPSVPDEYGPIGLRLVSFPSSQGFHLHLIFLKIIYIYIF